MRKEIKRNGKVTAWMVVLAIILGMISILPVPVAAQSTVVSIPDASAKTGETVIVPINITNVTNLGAATIWLSYDNSVVIVDSVDEGNMGGMLTPGINNTAGVTKISWVLATGKTGDYVFAYVTLNATGSADDTSELNLTVVTLKDTSNNPISYTEDDGVFTVEAGPVPLAAEAGGPYSGLVDQPIAITGSATGGTSPYSYAWDLDNDGAYDDATGATASKIWSTADTYTVGLQVTDSATPANVISTDTATVVVSEIVGALVSIPDASADTGKTVQVPINITNVTDLGAATIWLSYDNSVVIVDSVDEGNMGGMLTPGINNTAGVTKISWVLATGKTGDFVFAYVTLNATGSTDETSELNLTVVTLKDTGNNPISYTEDDGVFTVGVAAEVAIAINELLPNPVGSDAEGEFIELYNYGDTAADITGWTLEDAFGTTTSYPITGTIEAGEFKVFWRNETGITLNNDEDTIYLNNSAGTIVDSYHYASSTEGKSWARIPDGTGDFVETTELTPGEANELPLAEQVPISDGGEPDIALSNAGTIYVAFDGFGEYGVSIGFSESTDNGDTFSDPSGVSGSTSTWEYTPAIATDGENNVYAVWLEDDGKIYYARSTNGGDSFETKVQVSDATGCDGNPDIAVDSSGVIYVVWDGGDYIYVDKSTDGTTFGTDVIVDNDASPMRSAPSIAIDSDDNIHVAGHRSHVYYVKSTDGGATFTTHVQVDDSDVEAYWPSIVVDPTDSNKIYVAWKDVRDGSGDIYAAASDNGGATFGAGVKVNDDTTDTEQKYPCMAVNSSGAVFVVWQDGRNYEYDSDIYFAGSLDGGSSFSTNVKVNPDDTKAKTPTLTVDDTNAFVAWKNTDDQIIYFGKGVLSEWTPPVSEIVLTTITVLPPTAEVAVNGTRVFTATAKDQNSEVRAGIVITWTSSNETVGTVTTPATTVADGTATTTFTALVNGTTTVMAASGDVSGTAVVTVTPVNNKTGNIDGSIDDVVNMQDAIYLVKYLYHIPGYEEIHADGDINSDGTVNMQDAIYLVKYLYHIPGYEVLYP